MEDKPKADPEVGPRSGAATEQINHGKTSYFGHLKKSVFDDIQKIEQKKQTEMKKVSTQAWDMVMQIKNKEARLLNELKSFYGQQQNELKNVLDYYSLLQRAPDFTTSSASGILDDQIEGIKSKLQKIQRDVIKPEVVYNSAGIVENFVLGELSYTNNRVEHQREKRISVNGIITRVRSFSNKMYAILKTPNDVTFINVENFNEQYIFNLDYRKYKSSCKDEEEARKLTVAHDLNYKFQSENYDICRGPDGSLYLLVEFESITKARILKAAPNLTAIEENENLTITRGTKPVNKNEIQQMFFSVRDHLLTYDCTTNNFIAYSGDKMIIDTKYYDDALYLLEADMKIHKLTSNRSIIVNSTFQCKNSINYATCLKSLVINLVNNGILLFDANFIYAINTKFETAVIYQQKDIIEGQILGYTKNNGTIVFAVKSQNGKEILLKYF